MELTITPETNAFITALRTALLTSLGPRWAIEMGSTVGARTLGGKDLMDPPSVMHIFKTNKIKLTDVQFNTLITAFTQQDKVHMGLLAQNLIGKMNERRTGLVRELFTKLGSNKDNLLAANDIRRSLRIALHPLVVSGQATLDQVHTGFIAVLL